MTAGLRTLRWQASLSHRALSTFLVSICCFTLLLMLVNSRGQLRPRGEPCDPPARVPHPKFQPERVTSETFTSERVKSERTQLPERIPHSEMAQSEMAPPAKVSKHEMVPPERTPNPERVPHPEKVPSENPAALTCPPSGRLLSAAKGGRLGNIMFEYATLLGASHILHRPVWLLPKMAETLEEYFEPLSTRPLPVGCNYNWTEISVDALIKDAKEDRDYLIGGYPTAVHFFHPIRDRVLRELTFRAELTLSADRRLTELARRANVTSPTFIGVHVRRTDYATWLPKMVEGRLVDRDYLERALALMRSRHRDALFVVVSDDLEWCKNELISRSNSTDIVLAGDGVQAKPGTDLALLAACNHTVLTHGTFGFWGAYMAGGEVVAPTQYGKRRTGVETNVGKAGLNWTRIAAFTAPPTTKVVRVNGLRKMTS